MAAYEDSAPGVVALLLDDIAPPAPRQRCCGPRASSARMTRREVASRVGITPNDAPPLRARRGAGSAARRRRARRVLRRRPHRAVRDARADPSRRRTASRSGDESHALDATDADEVLGTYVEIVARLRSSKPGDADRAARRRPRRALERARPGPARTSSSASSRSSAARRTKRTRCTRRCCAASSSLPVAGLVAGLAVVTGVGIGVDERVSRRAPRAPARTIEAEADRARRPRAAHDRRAEGRHRRPRPRPTTARHRGARRRPRRRSPSTASAPRRSRPTPAPATPVTDGSRRAGGEPPHPPPVIAPDDTPDGRAAQRDGHDHPAVDRGRRTPC